MKYKIIKLAQQQIGNDYVKYCNDMGYPHRIEWCACFISWLATQLNLTDVIPVDMSCNRQIEKFKKLNAKVTKALVPDVGDIIYYDWDNSGDADHVGIVENNDGHMITVIEGNSGYEPYDRVRRRQIPLHYGKIFTVVRPNYPKLEQLPFELPLTKLNDDNIYVSILQYILYKNNILKSVSDVDGEFGPKTEEAVKEFQEKSDIEVDGIVGNDTWYHLLK